MVRLTEKGGKAQYKYHRVLRTTEVHWKARFGLEAVMNLREALERFVGESTEERSPLFEGLEPQPGSWRAAVRRPDMLPHYPMVLHRGGYPDGS
jgi:hypothetical protein